MKIALSARGPSNFTKRKINTKRIVSQSFFTIALFKFKNLFQIVISEKTMHFFNQRQPSTMPHIYIATIPTGLWSSSRDSNLQPHTREPGIVTTRPWWIP